VQKKTKSILGVLVVFILGTLCGALGVHIIYKSQIQKYISGDTNIYQKLIVRSLSKKLNLDQTQREKVKQYLGETQAELHHVRKQFRPQMDIILEKNRMRIREVLRAEQLEAFDKLVEKHKARGK
jgi:hypothetical protein